MAADRLARNRLGAMLPTCALVLTLSACASIQDFAGIERPGYQKDGSYVLSAHEQDLGCRALEERSKGLQEQMQELSQRAVTEMQQVPQTIANAWGRLIGSPGDGVPAVAEYNEARAEAAALDKTIARKGCASDMDTASIRR
jgi:hypothetical protein